MTFLKNKPFWSTLYLLCFFIFQSTPARALDISSLRFGTYPDKTRLVIDISETADFRTFTLSDPYRLVIDIPQFNWNASATQPPPQANISDIRQGKLSTELSRIVFDLKSPALIKSAFVLPANAKNKNARLVIDYTNVSRATFNTNKGTLYGTLKNNFVTKDNTTIHPDNGINPKQKAASTVPEKPVIILDPGHGGIDPGAIGINKVYEKTVVLSIAKELRRQLLATGRYTVYMTRDKDIFIKLKDRVKFARTHHGDLFVSMHADSVGTKSVHGTSIYTLSKKSSDKQTAALAQKENQVDLLAGVDLNIEDEQVAFILGDFLMNETMNQSKFFANTIVDTLHAQGVNTLDRTHRYAGFAVLKAPDIPSVLIETGFMSNAREARLLTQKEHQRKIATAIRRGIDAYFKRVHMNEKN